MDLNGVVYVKGWGEGKPCPMQSFRERGQQIWHLQHGPSKVTLGTTLAARQARGWRQTERGRERERESKGSYRRFHGPTQEVVSLAGTHSQRHKTAKEAGKCGTAVYLGNRERGNRFW